MISDSVLRRLVDDRRVPDSSRKSFIFTLEKNEELRRFWRDKRAKIDKHDAELPRVDVAIHDCCGSEDLPGQLVGNPQNSSDGTVRRALFYSRALLSFYRRCLGRDSIDGKGMPLVSSVHFSKIFSNAYWSDDALQMIYGDGDGLMLLDFTLSPEFVGHEITHGLTHFAVGLEYEGEAGALNESISDVFGCVFVQWLKVQSAAEAGWQIGTDIVGPTAKSLGWVCVRDLADPGSKHSMSQQPSDYDHFVPGGDPHTNSGIPNHAFYLAAREIGGRTWELLGCVWYATMLDHRCMGNIGFCTFGRLTIENALLLFPKKPTVALALMRAWQAVKVPV